MKWLEGYSLIGREEKQDVYRSIKTGHKVLVKKTKIQYGVVEINVLQKLTGNTFPKLLDYKISGDEMHLALQFIDGDTFDCLKTRDLCPFTANQIVLNSLSILQEIHRHGFLHCDIKPENMILDGQFRPYIIDFGAAQSLYGQRSSEELTGSVQYMPPEALYTPDAIDYRSDYYSLGKCLDNSFGPKKSLLSYNAIIAINDLCAIIPKDRPTNLTDVIETLKY